MPSFFSSRIITVLLVGLCAWLTLLAVGAHMRFATNRRELGALEDRILTGRSDNDRLAMELERMRQPAWLALLARTRLNVKLPDETVVFVYKSEKPGTISQPRAEQKDDRPNWRKWWDWVRDR